MTLELDITDVAYGGKGLARDQGRVVFVPATLPGETAQADVWREHKSYAEARLVRVCRASPSRVEPVCPLAVRGCPGCSYQHAAYPEELRIKHAQFIGLLSRLGGVDAAVCAAPLASPAALNYRNKMVLHASRRDGRVVLGYFLEDNTSIVDVEQCPLAVAPLNLLLRELRAKPRFLEGLGNGKAVTFRHTTHDGPVYWMGEPAANAVWLKEQTCLGRVSVPRGSFFQVNPAGGDILINHVMSLLSRTTADTVIDLYGGVGVFALSAVRAGKNKVVVVDGDGPAVKAAQFNLADSRADVSIISGDAETVLPGLLKGLRADAAVLIVDPPRSGLGKATHAAVCRAGPADLIYVSCAPDTLARDIAGLSKAGYRALSAQLIDMFPRTAHFESVTHLRRSG